MTDDATDREPLRYHMELRTRRPEFVPLPGWPRVAAVLVSVALAAGACGSTITDPATASGTVIASPASGEPRPADATPSPRTSPSPAPSATQPSTPRETPAATPVSPQKPTPTPVPSATPGVPPTPAATVVDTYEWVFDRHPMTLKGGTGTTRFTRVLFGARTVDLRWNAAGDGTACTFAALVESTLMAKPVKVSARVKAAKPASGTRGITANYGDATLTVTTDCARWSIKAVSTGHPGVIIKQETHTIAIQGDTAAKVKAGLDDAQLDWWINYTYRYRTLPLRLSSLRTTVRIVANTPTWTPPPTASPTLIAEWKTAIGALRMHQAGDAVIAIQAAGRFQAAAARQTKYRSPTAMQDAIEQRCSTFIESAQDRTNDYDSFTRRGFTQGVDIG